MIEAQTRMSDSMPRRAARSRTLLRAGLVLLAAALLVPLALILRPDDARSSRNGAAPPEATAAASAAPTAAALDPAPATPVAARATVAPAAPQTPSAARREQRTFNSRALGRSMQYLVWLPPGYDSNRGQRFPVLYMLHGMGGNRAEWTEYQIFEQAEQLINAGEIPPLIIVLAEGEQSYWMDHANNGPRWGAYIAKDLVGEIDDRYRTLADREHRAIGGNSMGAHGALQLALNYPDVFGVAGAHSPTLRRRDTLPPYFGDQTYFEAYDPVTLVQRQPEVARNVRLWVDIGDGDFWVGVAETFHRQLENLGVPHEFAVNPGGHEDDYWRGNAARYLRFYGEALR